MTDINYHGPVVAFDLDDTLFRERDFCRSGFQFLCDPLRYRVADIKPYPSKEELSLISRAMDKELTDRRNPFIPFEQFFKPLVEQSGFEWNLKEHIDSYRGHYPESLSLSKETEDVLTTLAAQNVRLAVITDGRSVTQRMKIKALGIDRFVDGSLILISEETGHDKHSKEMFATVVRTFPEASGFFYVGDNPEKDFYNPNLMGWTSIQVPYHSDNVHPETEPSTPFHAPGIKIQNLSSILQIIH